MKLKSYIFKFSLLISTFLLASCSNSSSPQFFNGHYYMTGDKDCRRFRQLDYNSITCYNTKHEETGYRTALTDQELMIYMHNQQMQAQQFNSIMNSVDNGNRQIERQNERMMFYNYLNMPRY